MSAPRVTVVGAGLAGATLAIYLGRRGWTVDVYERRPDLRTHEYDMERRSINLGLSHRGIVSLTDVGVIDRVMEGAVRARGRMIHPTRGPQVFQPYGRRDDECLWSISRHALNAALVDEAERHPGVRFHFGHTLEALEKETGTATFSVDGGETVTADADFVVGADGAFSAVRRLMQRGERADYAQEFLEWGYKELLLPADEANAAGMEWNALHIWPRGDCLVVSHPNGDRSHTCTLFLPFAGGDRSFGALRTGDDVQRFFRGAFPDLEPLLPRLREEFERHPTGTLVSVRTAPWHHGGRVVLVGDACHAVYPFYGQGMNAALEDCRVLDACLARHEGAPEAAFAAYQALRKPNTDALTELVKENFVELREKTDSRVFVARKKADLLLNRLFPRRWMPIYTMVVHTTMPYAEAVERRRRQDRIRRWLGIDALLLVALPLAAAAERAWRTVVPRRLAG